MSWGTSGGPAELWVSDEPWAMLHLENGSPVGTSSFKEVETLHGNLYPVSEFLTSAAQG